MSLVGPSSRESFHLDTTKFHDQIRRHLAQTSRKLHEATNARLFYWMLRTFVILPPKDPKAKRAMIKQYLNQTGFTRVDIASSGRRKGKYVARKTSKQFTRAHAIIQRQRGRDGLRGLYGAKMEKAYQMLMRRAAGSVGYLKSPLVKVLRQINGHFTQFGRKRKKGGDVPPNKALMDIASKYGLEIGSNIGIHKGAKGSAKRATPGLSPTAVANISVGVEDSQNGKVQALYNSSVHKAMIDEMEELRFHMADVVQASADEQFSK